MGIKKNIDMRIFSVGKCLCFFVLSFVLSCQFACAQKQGQKWITYKPGEGPGKGKHIVFISGDEEYRSEEALPMLAKILAEHHGFETTVLFAIDPQTGEIDPDNLTNIPGLEQLRKADLMVIFTRFRELPDAQMKYIDEYIKAGKPVVGMRTATHAFRYQKNMGSPYAKYDFNSKVKGWEGGFGRHILGETWINHHGDHGHEGTRGLINGIVEQGEKGAILNGVKDIWCATDVYTTRKLEGDPEVLVWGLPTSGMTQEAALNWKKSVMPVAWIKQYTSESGNTGRVFSTTMGAAVDLKSEDLRRLLVNACYWAMHMEDQIPEKSNVDIVGEYNPTMFGVGDYKKGLTPLNFK